MDNHLVPAQKQEFVIGQQEFSADNADLTVSMTLEQVSEREKEAWIRESGQRYTAKQRGSYPQNRFQCPSWEQRQAELEEDNAYTFFQ